jgi:hypothetical protein
MQFAKYLLPVAVIALFLPAAGFARDKNSATMNLTDPAMIGTTSLQPGTYKVEWSGSGSTVNVSIIQHKAVVATTTAELKTHDNAASEDAVILAPVPNNSSEKEIAEIDMANHKEALVINQTPTNPGQ